MYSYLRKDESLPGPWSEFFHDGLPFFLNHVTVHGWHCKVSLPHLLCQPINLYKGKQNVHKRFFTHKHMLSLHINDYISISCIPSIYMYLSLCVAEYDSLCDGQSIIEITKCIKLPLFSLNSHKELFDAFQCQLVTVIYKYVNVNQCFKNSTHQRLNVFKSQNLFYNSLNCKFILLQRAFLLTVL